MEQLALQTTAAAAALYAGVAVVIAIIIYAVIRAATHRSPDDSASAYAGAGAGAEHGTADRDASRIDGELVAMRDRLDRMSESAPHIGEIDDLKKSVDAIRADLGSHMDDVNGMMEAFRRTTAEDIDGIRKSMERAAMERVVAEAADLLKKNGVSRAEFDALLERFDSVHGPDEGGERMAVLSRIFDAGHVKVLNWQCRLVRLLRGGLAPDAERDRIIAEGIPESPVNKFLKRLEDHGIAYAKSIPAYYLHDEYEWIYSYTDWPDRLHRRLHGSVKREADYQRYVRAHVGLLEDGLIVEGEEYRLDTGRLDLVCRDSRGRAVGIELKYPAAAVKDKRQVASYRDDYRRRSGMSNSRFMLVAPSMPDELKRLLEQDGIEYREVPMDAGPSAAPSKADSAAGVGGAPFVDGRPAGNTDRWRRMLRGGGTASGG